MSVFIDLPEEDKIRYSEQIKDEIMDFRYFIELIINNDKSNFAKNILCRFLLFEVQAKKS